MAKKLNKVLGVDIGSRKIKIAEVSGSGGEAVITALGMIDTPEGAVDHTGVYNSEAVGAALKQAINEAGASVSHAVVSIAGQSSVLVRTLEVPRMNPTELKEHMQWEINRNIPFTESTVMSDFKVLPDEDPGSANMDVVMAIAPQSAVDTMLDCVKKAGKQVAAIDVEPLGLARSLTSSYADTYAGQSICVVDVGHKTMSINIFKDGKLLMPRQVPIGGEMFTQKIADSLSIPMDEAEQLKVGKCDVGLLGASTASFAAPAAGGMTQEFTPYNPFADEPAAPPTEAAPAAEEPPVPESTVPAPVPADPQSEQLVHAISPVVEEFVAEIRRSIDYFRSRGGDVNRVVLCGGGAKLKGLAEFLEKSLGLPCDSYDPLRRLNLSARKLEPNFVDEHRQEFAVAVGNGLHIFFD